MWERLNFMFSTEGAIPKIKGYNLSGKRTTIGRISGESHMPPKELHSQVKGQRKIDEYLSFLCPFCAGER